jgi:hypothetical protein
LLEMISVPMYWRGSCSCLLMCGAGAFEGDGGSESDLTEDPGPAMDMFENDPAMTAAADALPAPDPAD